MLDFHVRNDAEHPTTPTAIISLNHIQTPYITHDASVRWLFIHEKRALFVYIYWAIEWCWALGLRCVVLFCYLFVFPCVHISHLSYQFVELFMHAVEQRTMNIHRRICKWDRFYFFAFFHILLTYVDP